MQVHVIVDWDNAAVLAVYKVKESAETHVENECDEGDDVSIETMEVIGEE